MLKSFWFAFYAECLLLLRRSQEWLYPLGFFIVIMSIFPLAFSPDPAFLQKYIPGCVWISALLASLLSIENIFYTDQVDGFLEQQLLSSMPLTLQVIAKLGAHWLVTAIPLILLTPLLGWIFNLPAPSIVFLCFGLLLGTPILTLIGALTVALTLGLRQQGVMLGLLMFPLVTPVLIFGVNITQQAQAGFQISGPFAFLAGLSVFAITLLPFAIAAALRVGSE